MRRLLLAALALGAAVGSPPSAAAGTYHVSLTGPALHGRFGDVSQFAAGAYRGADTPGGVRLEAAPGTVLGAGGFAARSTRAPAGSRFVAVTATTAVCSAAPGMYGYLQTEAAVVTNHQHGAPVCTASTGSAPAGGQVLTLVLGAGPAGAAQSLQPSFIELQTLSALLADDVAPRDVAVTSPAAGGVVGIPQVTLAWSAADDLSGVAAVQVVQDGVAGPDVGGLPAADTRLLVGQRSGGGAAVAGSATVALAGPGTHELRVRVVDGAGNASESRPVRVTYVPPARPTAPPRVSGTAVPGGALTCDPGDWEAPAPALALSWRRDGAPIAGATGAVYAPTATDVGHRLDCRVTAVNAGTAAGGPPAAATSEPVTVGPAVRPALTERPAVRGIARAGGALTCDPGSWEAGPALTLAFAWRRDGVDLGIAGASYVPVAADVGRELDCRVTATVAGASTTVTSAPVRVGAAEQGVLVADATLAGRTLVPARRTTVGAGAAVRIVGRISGPVASGASVEVLVRHATAPTRAWRVPIGAGGRFTAAVRPPRGGDLVVRYAGGAAGPVERRVARLAVRPAIAAVFGARRAGRSLTGLVVRGRLTPAPGVVLRLSWQARPAAGGAWQAFCRDADGIRVAPDGRFAGRCRLPLRLYAGNRYRLVLQVQPHGPWARAVSPARRATVRR